MSNLRVLDVAVKICAKRKEKKFILYCCIVESKDNLNGQAAVSAGNRALRTTFSQVMRRQAAETARVFTPLARSVLKKLEIARLK